jgi:5-methylcytosine-specific restriction endonuclease McrA
MTAVASARAPFRPYAERVRDLQRLADEIVPGFCVECSRALTHVQDSTLRFVFTGDRDDRRAPVIPVLGHDACLWREFVSRGSVRLDELLEIGAETYLAQVRSEDWWQGDVQAVYEAVRVAELLRDGTLPAIAGSGPKLFHTWLRAQRQRHDPVGDLARDTEDDERTPTFRSLSRWVDHIGGPDSPAYGALLRGWREFARCSSLPTSQRVERVPRAPSLNPRQISTGTRTRIMERDGFRCRRCGAGPQDERLVIDHVVPVARGGSANDDNLQTLCEDCNQGKAARPPHPHDLELRR